MRRTCAALSAPDERRPAAARRDRARARRGSAFRRLRRAGERARRRRSRARSSDLLERIRVERGLASLFISHNLAVVARLCERVMVMYRGRIVETGSRRDIVECAAASVHARAARCGARRSMPARARRLLRRAARARPAAVDGTPVGAAALSPRAARRRCHRADAERRRLLQAGSGSAGRLPPGGRVAGRIAVAMAS